MTQPRKVLRPFRVPKHVPKALEDLSQWICWREKWNPHKSKVDKIPAIVANGHATGYLEQNGQSTYAEAIAAIGRLHVDGIGFALMDGEIIGGDLDNCRDPTTGVIETWALRLITFNETYCEVTPSGKGIRFFAFGALPGAARSITYQAAQVELYVGGRFLTFTGDHIAGTPMEIRPALQMVEALVDRITTMKALDGVAEAPGPSKTLTFAQWIYRQSPYGQINQAALKRLKDWVPELFPTAEFQPGTGAWRIKSADLGRLDLQEDLSIHPDGGKNFGVHDMGDPRGGKLSPIDIVTIHHPLLSTKEEAVEWLAETLNIPFDDAAANEPPVNPDADLWAQFHAALDELRAEKLRPQFISGGMIEQSHGRMRLDPAYDGPVAARAAVTDRLTRGYTAMISAAGNVGKSTYISLEALSIAAENATLLGQKEIDWCGHCLVVTNEENASSVIARWLGQMRLLKLGPRDLKHNLDVWPTDGGQLQLAKLDATGAVSPTKAAVEFVRALTAMARAGEPIAFLGLDPLASLTEGVPENSELMGKVIGILNLIAAAGFIAIDVAHHQGKAGDKESAMSFRGSSAIFAAVAEMSTLITLTAKEGEKYGFEAGQAKRTLRLMGQRQRDGAIPGVFYFERELMALAAQDPRAPDEMKWRTTATLRSITAPVAPASTDEIALQRALWAEQEAKRQIRRGGLKGGRHNDQAWVVMQDLHGWERARTEAAIVKLIGMGGAKTHLVRDPRGNSIVYLQVLELQEDEEELF